MASQDYDKSSKWLIQRYGKSLLALAGASNVRQCRALQAEVVQPRRLPDGLLEVLFEGQTKLDYVVVEFATNPERRVLDQAIDDLMLAYQHLRVLPELLTIVLHPKGRYRVDGKYQLQSRLQWSKLKGEWKVVELWTLPAKELLALGDVGLIPWVPLTHFDGPPEAVLEKCRHRIEQEAPPEQLDNMLAVSRVLAGLRFKDPGLLAILTGSRAMIDSPVIREIVAKVNQDAIAKVLRARFDELPAGLTQRLRRIQKESRLDDLLDFAAKCADLEEFRERLTS